MTRWIYNISIAIVLALLASWVLFSIANGSFPPQIPVFFPFLVTALIFAAGLTCVIWATGFNWLGLADTRERSLTILLYLEQAVRLNLPLPQLLAAARSSESGLTALGIERLRVQLLAGGSIAQALQAAVPYMSRRDLALVESAERVGRIGNELNRLVQYKQQHRGRSAADRSFLRTYPIAMIVIITAVVCMMMIFVIPKFSQIFRDFRVTLPPLTQTVIWFADLVDSPIGLFILLAVSVLGLLVHLNRWFIRWPGPVAWFTTNRDLSDICHVISTSLDAGMPLDAAIDSAAALAISPGARCKLRRWADGIVSGMPAADAAHAAHLPKLIAGLTTTAEGFAFLSRYYASQFSRAMTLLRAAAIPAMVFVSGFLVAVVALALFLPLIALINSLAPAGSPFERWL